MTLLKKTLTASALLLAGVVTLAACSSSPQAAGAASPAATATTAGSAMPSMTMSGSAGAGSNTASTAPVAGNAVTIKNFAFAPAALVVKVGTTVTWTNQDTDAHTVTSQGDGGPLASAALNTGQTFSYKFTKPGTYAYLCTIHPFMTATVTVTP